MRLRISVFMSALLSDRMVESDQPGEYPSTIHLMYR